MTHFAVAVISDGTKTVDELLAPYQENNMGDCPREYLEFFEAEEYEVNPETGKRGYFENPDARWDWFVIGGRWHGMLRATEGELGEPSWCTQGSSKSLPAGRFDSAKIKDIDFSPDQKVYDRAIAEWEYNVEGKGDDENLRWWCSTDSMIKKYGDKETYAKVESTIHWSAVITPDGQWTEVGGWRGGSEESIDACVDWALRFKERFIDPCNPECTIFVCDCHV